MNILLVEDDAGIGRFVTRGLTARGHRVSWQRQGNGVTTLAASGVFGAVLLDLGLPDMDGIDLCRDLRQAAPQVQIMMLTARDSLNDKLDGFDAGADDYLPKPFAFEELLARIQVLERRAQAQGGLPVLRYGDLSIDRERQFASWRGQTVALEGRAFTVLCVLAEAQGELVERTALIAAGWGADAEVTDNVLDVTISAVRRRLAALENAPRVETIRGRGFRLAL